MERMRMDAMMESAAALYKTVPVEYLPAQHAMYHDLVYVNATFEFDVTKVYNPDAKGNLVDLSEWGEDG